MRIIRKCLWPSVYGSVIRHLAKEMRKYLNIEQAAVETLTKSRDEYATNGGQCGQNSLN